MPYATESAEAHSVRLANEYGQAYRVPAGYYDRHFYYIYDAIGNTLTPILTAGQDYETVSILLYPDSEFILRRVNWYTAGLAGQTTFNFYWPDYMRRFIYYDNVQYMCNDMPIVPEVRYPAAGQIRLDVIDFQPHFNVGSEGDLPNVPYAQFVFQGAQRYRGTERDFATYPSCRKVYQTYVLDFQLNWNYYNVDLALNPTGVAPSRRFSVRVNEGDFELWAIQTNAGSNLKFNLVDPLDKTVFTNQVPIVASVFMDGTAPNTAIGQQPAGTWGAITPARFYPLGSDIVIDVSSLVPNMTPDIPIQFTFVGMTRRPK